MKVFAIGDLHLPGGDDDKSMEIFGSNWINHFERILDNWQKHIGDEDIVLIPGDISWAMTLNDAVFDLNTIGRLKGRKILLRGNHDFWWSAIGRVRALLPDGMYAIQNDSISLGDFCFCGSRGWLCPGAAGYSETNDAHLYKREGQRLRLSLEHADKSKRIICMMHYPPLAENKRDTVFSILMEEFGVEKVVYGHLHGRSREVGIDGIRNGIEYHLCSSDHLNFCPRFIAEM
ncbi:MAG: metallophosphoesterase [Clostridia bacterium]|nr:metallophosphoesterase [Clostridia bacterium]